LIAALIVVAIATAGGTVATYWFDPDGPPYARVATGVFLGLTALAFAAFAAAWIIGLGAPALVVGTVVAALPLAGLRSSGVERRVRSDMDRVRAGLSETIRRGSTAGTAVSLVYALAIVIVTWFVADRTFFANQDGLFIGNVNNLGDLPYHAQITASFAYGDNYPPQNPVFAGSGFSYHYISDFLAAVFVAAGASLREGILVVTLALGLALGALVHRWARDLTGNAIAARLAPLLLFFSGGLGFLVLLNDARVGGHGLLGTFFESDARYTMQNEGIFRFGNSVTTLLVPQRGLLLGMGLAVIVLTLLWREVDLDVPKVKAGRSWREAIRQGLGERRMIVAGILTGLLPIVHVHTFAVVFGTAFLLGLVFRQWRGDRWRAWVPYVVATVLVALPVAAVTASGSQANASSFVGFELGWEHGQNNLLIFWLANAGTFIPLLVAAYAWRGERPLLSRKLVLYSIPFLAWFVVPNVLRLAPWIWDNIKVLIYWWLGGVPLVALVLARLWQEYRLAGRIAAVGLAVVVMASGGLDVARATVGQTYQEFDRDGIAFAEMIREETPPSAVVLTAPTYNTPVFLTGRPVFMGYTGFLFANGLPYPEREQEVKTIYSGAAGADALIARNRIEYIVVGPQGTQRVQRGRPERPVPRAVSGRRRGRPVPALQHPPGMIEGLATRGRLPVGDAELALGQRSGRRQPDDPACRVVDDDEIAIG
jgi:hypothetical protein